MLGLPILAEIKENVFFSSSLVQKSTYVEAPGLSGGIINFFELQSTSRWLRQRLRKDLNVNTCIVA